jgi:hypothetical protein
MVAATGRVPPSSMSPLLVTAPSTTKAPPNSRIGPLAHQRGLPRNGAGLNEWVCDLCRLGATGLLRLRHPGRTGVAAGTLLELPAAAQSGTLRYTHDAAGRLTGVD